MGFLSDQLKQIYLGSQNIAENKDVDSFCLFESETKQVNYGANTVNDSYSFYTKVVGVTQEKNRQLYVSKCYKGQELELIRERTNPYDSNAIAVYAGNNQLGYIKRELAEKLAKQIDCGINFECTVEEVTGGGDRNYGVNIKIRDISKKQEREEKNNYTNNNSLNDVDLSEYYDYSDCYECEDDKGLGVNYWDD